VVAIVKIAMTS